MDNHISLQLDYASESKPKTDLPVPVAKTNVFETPDDPWLHECWGYPSISNHEPTGFDLDISLLEHVSPIEWDNIVLYGEYVVDFLHPPVG